MAADSSGLSSFAASSSFVIDLPTASERFLARVLAHTFEDNWRNADAFLIHFPPRDIMRALAGQEALRAAILIGAAGVNAKLARKKPLKSATEDLELALAEGVTDAEQILELFSVDDRVRFLNKQRLWSFVSEEAFWQSTASDRTRSVERMAFLVDAALHEDLITRQQVVESMGFAEIAEHLPPPRLKDVVRRALELGHSGRPLDEAALLEEVALSELLEVIPLDHVFRNVIVARIAVPSGFGTASRKPSQSVIPQLADPKEDAEVESLFDALQSHLSGEEAAKSESKAGQTAETPVLSPSPSKERSDAPDAVPASPFARPPDEEEARDRVCGRLEQMGRLPPSHEALPLFILLAIESMYGELLTLRDDEARERCIDEWFPNKQDLRIAMLALIDLLDPTIETSRTTIRDCDIDSLIAVVVFEERVRQERKTAAQNATDAPVRPPRSTTPGPATRKSSAPAESGMHAVATPPPLPKPASRKR